LQLRAEHLYPVPALAERDAVALFVTRAAALDVSVGPSAAVAHLCERLDELPLALELAAARTPLFSVEQLLDRVGQRLDLLKGGRDSDPASERCAPRSSGATTSSRRRSKHYSGASASSWAVAATTPPKVSVAPIPTRSSP